MGKKWIVYMDSSIFGSDKTDVYERENVTLKNM